MRNVPLRCNLGHKPHAEPCSPRPSALDLPRMSRFCKHKRKRINRRFEEKRKTKVLQLPSAINVNLGWGAKKVNQK